MKLLTTFITALVSISSFGFTIKGVATNAKNGDLIYIYQRFSFELTAIDSTKINNNNFIFKDKKYTPGMYQLGTTPKNSFVFIAKEPTLNIEIDYANLMATHSMPNSEENKLFYDYSRFMGSVFPQYNEAQLLYGKINKMKHTNPAYYNANLPAVKKKVDSLELIINTFNTNVAKKHPTTFTGMVAKAFIFPDSNERSDYFTKDNFTNESLVYGDMLSNKFKFFYQKYFKGINKYNYVTISNAVLNNAPPKSIGRNLAYLQLIIDGFNLNREQGFHLIRGYKKEFGSTPLGKKMLSRLPVPPPTIGEMAPDIVLKSPEGKVYKLSDLRGKVVLIDFWASWCGPCRGENPNVVQEYQKYKNKGFTIYSVSLDQNVEKWKAAIAQDKLDWNYHVSDLKGWKTSPGKTYGVTGIPTNFLLDKNGKIIATNLRGAALGQKLAEVFSK